MNIGFIGVGNMGYLMCKNLLKPENQLQVTAYDKLPERVRQICQLGAREAKSPREVSRQSDVIITMLPESSDTKEVILGADGVIEALNPGQIIIDMGTGSPSIIREISRVLTEKQAAIVDAPVSGGVGKAATGELSIMASGDKAAFDKCHDIFKILGKEIFHISTDVGTGHTVKIINNLVQGVNLAAICEAMVLAVKAGLDPEMFLDILNKSSGESYASKVKVSGFIFKRDFSKGFQAKLQYKDMNLATTLAKELNIPLGVGNLAKEYYMAAMAAGRGEMDASVIVTLLEDITKVTVKPQR